MNDYSFSKLNLDARKKMKGIINTDVQMQWEDQNILNIMIGQLPEIRYTNYDSSVSEELKVLHNQYSKYDYPNIDRLDFYKTIETSINTIRANNSSWYGLDEYYVKEAIDIHEFCLISGEGGIGKSHFLYCLEKELDEKSIPHLCLYGKFVKTCQCIPVDEILQVCDKQGFVFVFDAINEMTDQGQVDLFNLAKQLSTHKKMRIILSYRLNSLDSALENQFKQIAKHCYSFPGVSFESAMGELTKLAIPDLFKYEDILYSNNALLLSMLCTALTDEEIVNGEKNSIASVTFILEHYVKKSLKKTFGEKVSGSKPRDIWIDMKKVASWMYEHEQRTITESDLLQVVNNGDLYIKTMKQARFMESYESEGAVYYIFAIDSLTDFLIARSLFDDIAGKIYDEQVDLIKRKTGKLYNLDAAFVIALFDNLSPDYNYISELLKDTELVDNFGYDEILKINFQEDNIDSFLEVFSPVNPNELIQAFGGYSDKPFNCVNYLNDYYFGNKEHIQSLSKQLSGARVYGNIQARLKNMIYFVAMGSVDAIRLEEAFYFAAWCASAPNKNIRYLAQKLLYEVVSKDDNFLMILIERYADFVDPYIQEAIIYVLSTREKNDYRILQFFNKLIKECELSARSIRRISKYLGEEYGYINWDRPDVYRFGEDSTITEEFSRLLTMMDLMNKNYFPFRYCGKDHIDMYTKFLENDKATVSQINKNLEEKFVCVKTGECCGSSCFDKRALEVLSIDFTEKTIDMDSFFASFERVMNTVFMEYQMTWDDSQHMGELDFINSSVMKCVDIATGLFYGSLMCNYYVDSFASYNNYQDSIGYEVFDPLEYGEDFPIVSPVPIFYDVVEKLGDIVISRLQIPDTKDVSWVDDIELTRRNVLSLLEPINYKRNQWHLIAGRISIHDHEKNDLLWKDTYDIWCCTKKEETILDDGRARYLTIELDDYSSTIETYRNTTNRPWLCKDFKNNATIQDLFEETTLVLPPAELLTELDLVPDTTRMVWVNSEGEDVVICNNTKNSYYRDPIGSSVFIRGDFLQNYLANNNLKYFAFTERFIPSIGYSDKTALHFEIENGVIQKEIVNDGRANTWPIGDNPLCKNCPYEFGDSNTSQIDSTDILEELLSKYGI